jgi:hypothetical protein
MKKLWGQHVSSYIQGFCGVFEFLVGILLAQEAADAARAGICKYRK